jgi:hypothetical protein
MPPYPSAPGVSSSQSSENLAAAQAAPPPARAGGVVVNKVQANRIPTNKTPSPVSDFPPPPAQPASASSPVETPGRAPAAAPSPAPPAAMQWAPPPAAYKPASGSATKRMITPGLLYIYVIFIFVLLVFATSTVHPVICYVFMLLLQMVLAPLLPTLLYRRSTEMF